jgi:uncharacterized membrane protein
LLDLRPSRGVERAAVAADEAVAQGLATAKVYAFASADYPGAAQSDVFDTDGTTTVGAFVFDPSNANSPTTAFTFKDGVYQILTVPGSTSSIATSINSAGLIVGVYGNLANETHGFADVGGTFSNIDFPGATWTQAIGVNDAEQIVGSYSDAASVEHGFVSSGGTFSAINVPGPPVPRPPGSTPLATSSEAGRMQPVPTAFCSRPGCSLPSTFRLPPTHPPSASTTPGR